MERQADKKFYYEKTPKKLQVSIMMKLEIVARIDALKMSGEKRSAVIRRVIDAGLPSIERQTKLMRSEQAALAPIPEEK